MSVNKTLYISDLDGTLLNKSAELSEYTINSLNSLIANGTHFSIATARTLASSGKILSGLTLRLPIVLMNGVLIYDMEQQEYTQINTLIPKSVKEIINTLRRFEITGFMYELKDGELVTYITNPLSKNRCGISLRNVSRSIIRPSGTQTVLTVYRRRMSYILRCLTGARGFCLFTTLF